MNNQTFAEDKSTPADVTEAALLLLGTVQDLVNELHSQQNGIRTVRLDSYLDSDLGFDSLGRVELMARIEKRFHCTLPEQVFGMVETPRDFLRYIVVQNEEKRGSSSILPEDVTIEQLEAVQIPLSAATLNDVLLWHAARHPDRIHIRFYNDSGEEDVLTYHALLQGAEKVAAALQKLGLGSRESVMIMLPSSRDYFFSFFGTLLAGGVPVPVYPPGNIRQIEEHLRRHAAIAENCLAAIMITMPETVRFSKIMKSHVPGLHHLVTFTELNTAAETALHSFLKPVVSSGDIAFLQYTSGSTGMPKGVVLSHANLLANVRSMGSAVNVQAHDVFVSWLPLYHDMGLIGAWLGSLYFACQLVLMSPLNFIAKPSRWLQAISRYGGTLSAAPNFAYELCVRRIDDREKADLRLDSWRIAFNGAEAVSPQTIQRFTSCFESCGFQAKAMTPVYGLAESSVGLAFPPLDRGPLIDRVERAIFMESGKAVPASAKQTDVLYFVSCGLPLPRHQIRIADSAGREMPERREGAIQFQGPSTTAGYYRNPEKNKELFDGQWLNSGDRGYIAAGELFISGRSKDIIIRAGRNIYPEEIEEAVGKIEGIRSGNVAVFGSIDQSSGTEKLVVLAESRKKDNTRAQLVNTVNNVVTAIAGTPPDEVVIAPPNTVLKTSSGKIRRTACRDSYERGISEKQGRAVWFQVGRFWLTGVPVRIHQFKEMIVSGIYAGYCWLLFLLGGVIGICLSVLSSEVNRWKIMRGVMKTLACLAGWKIQISGEEHLPPPETACIFVSNHASYIDGFVLLAVLPRIFSFVAKVELRRNPIAGFLLDRIGTEYVERFDRKKGIEDSANLLQRAVFGRSLLYFAEGTFVRMPGLLPFRMGAFETAAKGELLIVPIALRGTRSILRAESWFPRRGSIQVVFGKPVAGTPGETDVLTDHWNRAVALRDKTRAWILGHCGEPDLKHECPLLFAEGIAEKSQE